MPLTQEEKNALALSFDVVVNYFKDETAQAYYFGNREVSVACILKMRIMPASLFLPLFGPKNNKPSWPSEEAKQAFDNFCFHITKLNNCYMQTRPMYRAIHATSVTEQDAREAVDWIEQLIERRHDLLMGGMSKSAADLQLNNNSGVSYGYLMERFEGLFSQKQPKKVEPSCEIITTYNTKVLSYSL